MQPPIKTNKIVFKLDKEKFSEKYDLFAVKTSKKHFNSGAYILDSPEISDKILSIYYYSGKCIYVLMKKSNDSKMNLKKAISETDEAENITISKIECCALEDYITLQLLFNAIGSYESDLLRASNLTGRLFCYNPSWIIHGITGDNKNTKQIVCLELKITSDYVLRFDVRTFTSVKYKSKITFSKKKFEEYPQYVIGKTGKYTISRKLPSDNDCNSFILRQIDGKKSNRPFFDIYNYDKSKLLINYLTEKDMEKNYSELSPDEKKIDLYLRQKHTLDLFLERNAISKAQYDKSLSDLTEKMGINKALLKSLIE